MDASLQSFSRADMPSCNQHYAPQHVKKSRWLESVSARQLTMTSVKVLSHRKWTKENRCLNEQLSIQLLHGFARLVVDLMMRQNAGFLFFCSHQAQGTIRPRLVPIGRPNLPIGSLTRPHANKQDRMHVCFGHLTSVRVSDLPVVFIALWLSSMSSSPWIM